MKYKQIGGLFTIVFIVVTTIPSKSQTAKDLFNQSYTKISWLGIDFSHTKLIGDFSQFFGMGQKSNTELRDKYFPAWNKLILAEPEKYDLKGMLRKQSITYDIDMLMKINSQSQIEQMESYNTPNYTKKDIEGFVSAYNAIAEEGIGLLLIAESLNKNSKEAYFHFAAINLKSKELLIHERLRGEPGGFGIRNYWAGSIDDIINQITRVNYKIWRSQYK